MDDAKLNELTDDELAELTATKVMGWTACWPENVGEEWWYDGDEPIRNVEKWNPCNDWNDMRLVIEQLIQMGFKEFNFDFRNGDIIVTFYHQTEIRATVEGTSLERIILEFALKAAGVDVE